MWWRRHKPLPPLHPNRPGVILLSSRTAYSPTSPRQPRLANGPSVSSSAKLQTFSGPASTPSLGTPLGSGEPSLLPGPPWSFLLVLERFLHVSPDPSRFLRRRASTGVTWILPCRISSLALALCGVSSFSQLSLVNASTGIPRSILVSFLPRINRLSTSCRRSSAFCTSGC